MHNEWERHIAYELTIPFYLGHISIRSSHLYEASRSRLVEIGRVSYFNGEFLEPLTARLALSFSLKYYLRVQNKLFNLHPSVTDNAFTLR